MKKGMVLCFIILILNLQIAVSMNELDSKVYQYHYESKNDGEILIAESLSVVSGDGIIYEPGVDRAHQANSYSMVINKVTEGERVKYSPGTKNHKVTVKKVSGPSVQIGNLWPYVNDEKTEIPKVLQYALDVLWDLGWDLAKLPLPSPFGYIFDEDIEIDRGLDSVEYSFGYWDLMGGHWAWFVDKDDGKRVGGNFNIEVTDYAELYVFIIPKLGNSNIKKIPGELIQKPSKGKINHVVLRPKEDAEGAYMVGPEPFEIKLEANFRIMEDNGN